MGGTGFYFILFFEVLKAATTQDVNGEKKSIFLAGR
jgi:hypothetical protein